MKKSDQNLAAASRRLLKQLPNKFVESFKDYRTVRISRPDASHDYIRQIFINFLQEAYKVKCSEIEIEKGIFGAQLSGFIDALFGHVIFEFKKNFNREREKGVSELKRYFSSRNDPDNYFGILTDGFIFESFRKSQQNLISITTIDIRSASEQDVYLWFDSFIFSPVRGAGGIIPDAADMLKRFGPLSPVCVAAIEKFGACFERVASKSEVKTKYEEWNHFLAKVYGSKIGRDDLFVNHTYLSLVSKILAFSVVLGRFPSSQRDLMGLVTGDVFRDEDITNLAEPDFFMWVKEPEIWSETEEIIAGLVKHLNIFNVSNLNIDILQQLYEGLVAVGHRHDLGEYYTPCWLAEITLRKAGFSKKDTMLDPSCGSGTFLFYAIQLLREQGLKGKELVAHATNSLAGIEVHPVAISIARCNFVLALGKDLRSAGKELHIPIYMADTLTEMHDSLQGPYLSVSAPNKLTFHVPVGVDETASSIDQTINEMERFAEKPKADALQGFKSYLERQKKTAEDMWLENLGVLRQLVEKEEDHVWPFILRNATKPALLARKKFTLIAGNPPWLSYRYIKDASYSKRLKDITLGYHLLEKREQHLFTHMEMATAFFAYCADIFLENNGRIGFVMPRSVISGANQHLHFQKFDFGHFKITPYMILDCNQVEPLFNVPTCVLFAIKANKLWKNVPSVRLIGEFPQKNLNLATAKNHLAIKNDSWHPDSDDINPSCYYERVLQGATIVPRSFWFVDPKSAVGPVSQDKPTLKTSQYASHSAKKPWTQIEIDGKVEADFLYGTAIGDDLVPFGLRTIRPVVLPVLPKNNSFKLINSKDALREGFVGLSHWTSECEKLWEQKSKTDRTLNEWIDYNGKLLRQNPLKGIYVVFNGTASNLTASVIDTSEVRGKKVNGVPIKGFFIDCKFYYVRCESFEEAHYLSGFLNTPYVNHVIKKHQTVGSFGARDIHRRPFLYVPIPKFEKSNPHCMGISRLSMKCHDKVEKLRRDGHLSKKIGQTRGFIREALQGEIKSMDLLTRALLGKARRKFERSDQSNLIKPQKNLKASK